jgi:UDP-N-acetylglucosamine:LPS N-acetylglucosamine transferase
LAEVINEMIGDPEKLKQMAVNSRKMGMPDAADRMYSVLREVAS